MWLLNNFVTYLWETSRSQPHDAVHAFIGIRVVLAFSVCVWVCVRTFLFRSLIVAAILNIWEVDISHNRILQPEQWTHMHAKCKQSIIFMHSWPKPCDELNETHRALEWHTIELHPILFSKCCTTQLRCCFAVIRLLFQRSAFSVSTILHVD